MIFAGTPDTVALSGISVRVTTEPSVIVTLLPILHGASTVTRAPNEQLSPTCMRCPSPNFGVRLPNRVMGDSEVFLPNLAMP